MVDCRPCETPIDQKYRLENDEERATTDKGQYQRLVGKVIYLAHTRPNIAYAVSVVSQFMHNPKDSHLQVVYRLLRYLKSTLGKRILYKNHGNLNLECYTDADYAGALIDRRSTSGYSTLLGGNLVT
jgi:hypothetical protein